VRCNKPSLCSFLHKTQKIMVAGDCVSNTHRHDATLCV